MNLKNSSVEAQGAGNAVTMEQLNNPEWVKLMLLSTMKQLVDTQQDLIKKQCELVFTKKELSKLRREYRKLDDKYMELKFSNLDI